jgi:hypothetical protein
MNISSQKQNNFFIRGIASVVIIAPFLLVIAASTMPEGLARGDLIVYGHEAVLAALAAGLLGRAVFALVASKVLNVVAWEPKHSATA